MELKDGLYRLTKDVKNPSPDRRKKDDWSALPVWKAGMEFGVNTLHYIGENFSCQTIFSFAPQIRYARNWEKNVLCEEFSELISALEPIEVKTYTDLVKRENYYEYDSESILNELVKSGKVTLDDIRAAKAQSDAEYDAKEAANGR